ncbi:MAG: hypothetical protein AAGA61_09975 [Pseudomonadota bacterium]
MLRSVKKTSDKVGITYFGLLGHEVAVLKSTVENAPALAADFELRDPNDADACAIVMVNKDSHVANSWWKRFKQANPAAVPLFLTDDRNADNDTAYCKRPFSPSFVQAAVQNLASRGLA